MKEQLNVRHEQEEEEEERVAHTNVGDSK